MDNLTLFGRRLRSIRGRRARASVAEAAKITVGYLGELERGEKWPTLDVILELAKALAVQPSTFFEFESEEVNPDLLRQRLSSILVGRETAQLQRVLRLVQALLIN